MKRQLVYYDNPLLRKRCVPVAQIDDEIRQLVADMIETMDAARGAGLSAIQIGVLLRVFILRPYYQTPSGHYELSPVPEICINPVLSEPSGETESQSEGCLSIPGLRAEVVRPLGITVQALDLEGTPYEKKVWGYNSRIYMHENDHLNGVLFIDRISPKARRELDPELQRIKKRYRSV